MKHSWRLWWSLGVTLPRTPWCVKPLNFCNDVRVISRDWMRRWPEDFADIEAGRVTPADEVFARLIAKYEAMAREAESHEAHPELPTGVADPLRMKPL